MNNRHINLEMGKLGAMDGHIKPETYPKWGLIPKRRPEFLKAVIAYLPISSNFAPFAPQKVKMG